MQITAATCCKSLLPFSGEPPEIAEFLHEVWPEVKQFTCSSSKIRVVRVAVTRVLKRAQPAHNTHQVVDLPTAATKALNIPKGQSAHHGEPFSVEAVSTFTRFITTLS